MTEEATAIPNRGAPTVQITGRKFSRTIPCLVTASFSSFGLENNCHYLQRKPVLDPAAQLLSTAFSSLISARALSSGIRIGIGFRPAGQQRIDETSENSAQQWREPK